MFLTLPKVHLHKSDLKSPQLSLSEADARQIFAVTSSIIHSGAEISHAQSYRSLKPANLQATNELVKMSLPRRIPLHFVSTTEVGTLFAECTSRPEFPGVSVSMNPLASDGRDGYLATKWASERFLERLDHELGGWPVYIHRPSLISQVRDSPSQDIVQEIRNYAIRMGAVPVAPNYRGYLNSVSQEAVVSGILGALREGCEGVRPGGVQFRHHFGDENFSCDDPKESLRELFGDDEIGEMPVMEWAGHAANLGLDAGIVKMGWKRGRGAEAHVPQDRERFEKFCSGHLKYKEEGHVDF